MKNNKASTHHNLKVNAILAANIFQPLFEEIWQRVQILFFQIAPYCCTEDVIMRKDY